MSDFDKKGKKYKGRLLFFAVFIVLIVIFFVAQKNTGTPKQTEVEVNLPTPTSQPASQPSGQENGENKSDAQQGASAGGSNENASNPSASVTDASATAAGAANGGDAGATSTSTATEVTPSVKPNRRPTPSKIPVSQVENPQPETGNAVNVAQVDQTQQDGVQTSADTGEAGALTVQAQTGSDAFAPTQVQNEEAVSKPQVASVSIRNNTVHFRFAEAKNHVADGAKNALEGVASSAKGGRYLVISPFYSDAAEAKNTKLAEQRILNIKKLLSELNVPDQQVIVLKPQNPSSQNSYGASGEYIDVFAVQSNAYSADQVWNIK